MLDGLLLGFLTWMSFTFSFMHLPERIKRFMLRHFVFTDIISVCLTFLLLSSISHSITSVIGSITCGLLINMSLMANKYMYSEDEQQV